MKQYYWLFLLFLFVAASPFNSSEFVVGDEFFVDDSRYEVLTTLVNGSEILTPRGGRIYRVDACAFGQEEYFCVAATSNVSVTLDFYLLGEVAGDYEQSSGSSSSSSSSGESSASQAQISDYVSFSLSYEERPIIGSLYNVSLSVEGLLEDTSSVATFSLLVPGAVEVVDSFVFNEYSEGFYFDVALNESVDAWLTYRVTESITSPLYLYVESSYNKTQLLQEYVYAFSNISATPLWVEPSFRGVDIPSREEYSASVRVFNNNSFAVPASVAARSVLVDYEGSVTVPANGYFDVDFLLFANRSGEFGVLFVADYSLVGQDMRLTDFVSLTSGLGGSSQASTPSQSSSVGSVSPSPLAPSGPSAFLSGPSILQVDEVGELVLSVRQAPVGEGLLEWLLDGEVISSSLVGVVANDSFTQNITVGGAYSARLTVGEQELSASYVVSTPASSQRFSEREEEVLVAERSFAWGAWLVAGGLLGVFLFGSWFVFRLRATRYEQELLDEYELVLSWAPLSAEEARVRAQLLAELRRALEQNS